ncbi:GNAT family N-acetyltransferase [Amaricoccus sp.]|uniref:GNAT family N-acetyltransferase n=1 Tax=Amaricoccus sp. TaxID=1872485 RepID=UPI001B674C13|nr:GNAT family N-acetyltransferase [Amaricoccus sp.]MBP7243547.1 GNAT family N-acetyltransferase [Amaricoccus sp.]
MTAPWERVPAGPAAGFAAAMAAVVPEIVTPRLRLRAPRVADYPLYAGFARDDRGAGLARGETDETAWLDFCALVASWPLRGFGPWTLEPRAGGPALGAAVLNHEFGDPEPEVGWLVAPEAEGRGFASEGARAALAHAFGPLGMASIVSYVGADNPRSARVAERLGGRRDGAAEAALGDDVLVFRHSPGDLA